MTLAADFARLSAMLLDASILAKRLEIQVAADPGAVIVVPASPLSPQQRLHVVGDESLSARQLAIRAGCGLEAMRKRLRSHTAAEALAMGAYAAAVAEPAPPKQRAPRHALNGEPMSIAQLADRAGCSAGAMQMRLSAGMTAEQAVAAGARMLKGRIGPRAPVAPADPPSPPGRSVFEHRVAAPAPIAHGPRVTAEPAAERHDRTAAMISKRERQRDASAPAVDTREVIVPPDVKRTVWQTPAPASAPVPSIFGGRIGRYEATGSVVERAYGGERS